MNFRDNIKEHQDLMKENIEHLQKKTRLFQRGPVLDIHIIFYMSSIKN